MSNGSSLYGSSLYGSSLYQRCPKNPISTSGPGCPWSGGVVHPEAE